MDTQIFLLHAPAVGPLPQPIQLEIPTVKMRNSTAQFRYLSMYTVRIFLKRFFLEFSHIFSTITIRKFD